MSRPPSLDVVIPTIGRPSLGETLAALAAARGPRPGAVWVVNDRPGQIIDHLVDVDLPVKVLAGRGRGPAAARNVGWRESSATWIAFLDDDVVPDPDWATRLSEDLAGAGPEVAGVQGLLRVPLPNDRRPTDWERNVAGLAEAQWVTADMAYRREALEDVGGFDERFRRAYREDADLALRLLDAGYRLQHGTRASAHPVRPAGPWTSVRLQAGNADDVLMWGLHGPGWRRTAGAPSGRLPVHLATTAAGAIAAMAALRGRRELASLALTAWAAATAEFAVRRIAPGPRTAGEVVRMLWTSVVIPPTATAHWIRGWLTLRARLREQRPRPLPAAVLLDRDGTIVRNVPYNGNPELVQPVAGARTAIDRLRNRGLATAVITNQSGVGRGLLSEEQVAAVNRRIEEVLGPLGPWVICTHSPAEGCGCRKPAPGLILEATRRLGVTPSRCVVIGDTAADVEAAEAVGARGILVPNEATRANEVRAAREVARDLEQAVDLIVGGTR